MPLTIAELETPIPVVDLDRLARNLDRAAEYAKAHGLGLRPHIKTHKSPRIAGEQLTRGAVGVTCATPYEAEVMSEVCSDILVAYPPVGPKRAARLATLARKVRLTVALDSIQAVDDLARAATEAGSKIGVCVELDLGMHRVGLPVVDDAIALARAVRERPSLEFAGIAFYPGHVREPVDQQTLKLDQLKTTIGAVLTLLDTHRLHY